MKKALTLLLLFCAFPFYGALAQTNDPPDANNDTAETVENTPVEIDVLANDDDDENDDLIIVDFTTKPDHGFVQVVDGGEAVLYTPYAGYTGSDDFRYVILDEGGNTAAATVTIDIEEDTENDDPVAREDRRWVLAGGTVDIDVLANDDDPDGDDLVISGVDLPSYGTAAIVSGKIRYTANAGTPSGTIDRFDYEIRDEAGNRVEARIRVRIYSTAPSNDEPSADDDLVTIQQGQTIDIPVLLNDLDEDGDDMEIQSVTEPEGGETSIINDRTAIRFIPDPDFSGTYTFSYVVADEEDEEDQSNVFVTVEDINDNPVAKLDTVSVVPGSTATISVLNNDTDEEDDDLIVVGASLPAHGTVTTTSSSVRYTPANDYTGSDTFKYYIRDEQGGTAVGTVNVTVRRRNSAPLAVDDAVTTEEDKQVTIDVTANDNDDDEKWSLRLERAPSHGTAVINNRGTSNTADDVFVYTPAENYSGTDRFVYRVSDEGNLSDTASVRITIEAINDPPSQVSISAVSGCTSATSCNLRIGGGDNNPVDPTKTLVINWDDAGDPEGDDVAYTWYLSTSSAFGGSGIVMRVDTGSESNLTLTYGDIAAELTRIGVDLNEERTLHHRVVAWDGEYSIPGRTAQIRFTRGTITDAEGESDLPTEFALQGNYPNPFNPTTTIRIDLPESAEVMVQVFDLAGRNVLEITPQTMSAGKSRSIQIDGSNLVSGVYIYRIHAMGQNRSWSDSGRLVLIK